MVTLLAAGRRRNGYHSLPIEDGTGRSDERVPVGGDDLAELVGAKWVPGANQDADGLGWSSCGQEQCRCHRPPES